MADREPLDPSTEESPVPADFDWTLTAADDRFRRHGAALFRVRSWSLRVPSLIGFGGVYLALHIAPGSKALALIVLAAFVLPAIALAPGLTIATLTAARDRTPSGWELLDGVGRAPGYALLSLLHFFARGVRDRSPICVCRSRASCSSTPTSASAERCARAQSSPLER